MFSGATQTVFGAGPADARLVLIGEQPGDQEDREGEPFVGPAGTLLRKALREAGIDEGGVYFTNAVKHFKYTTASESGRGKRRIHKAPNLREMRACKPWLRAELDSIRPELVVALGGTAGKALLGSSFRVGEHRGVLEPLPDGGGDGARLLVTVHPSSVLRSRDRAAGYQGLVRDLRTAARALA